MTPAEPLDRHERIERLLEGALALPEVRRADYLLEQCADDDALRAEVESLLAHAPESGPFVEAVGALWDAPEPEQRIRELNLALEGRYVVERALGAGGMSTVYAARDLKHGRTVALKVLHAELAAVIGAQRFVAEIETTAKLNHPHVLSLYDSGEAGGSPFFTAPYVRGESLRERIDREGPLGVGEAVTITTKVAAALDHAHRHGVLHRDVKPGNILLSSDREPLVSDFGIARALVRAGGERITEVGVKLGTLQYMSPEQASGGPDIDHRTDVYALGCVLYEMLVGEPPHRGPTSQAVFTRILRGSVRPPSEARPDVPPHVETAVLRALARAPEDRFRSAGDFAGALLDPGFGAEPETAADGARSLRSRLSGLIGGAGVVGATAGLLGGALLGAAAMVWSGPGIRVVTPDLSVRFELNTAPADPLELGGAATDLALSSDGRRLVYRSTDGSRLLVRSLDRSEWMPVAGTGVAAGAAGPFFSPDGGQIGFQMPSPGSENAVQLRRVRTEGGAVATLTEQPGAIYGATWAGEDRVVFGLGGAGLMQVPATRDSGGRAEPLTTPSTPVGEVDHRWPAPVYRRSRPRSGTRSGGGGGNRDAVVHAVVFVINHGDPRSNPELAVLDLDDRRITRLGITGTRPRYVGTGHLVYAAGDGQLHSVPFDAPSLRVTGSPTPLEERVLVKVSGAANFDISEAGHLVYVAATVADSTVADAAEDAAGTAVRRPIAVVLNRLASLP